jgi:single-stranded DNA-binding protein
MESFNAVGLVGFLELDISTRFHGERPQVTTFTVRLEEQGAEKVHRVYVPMECYGRTAERTAYLSAGTLIGVQGKLVYRRSPERDGTQTGRLTVLASSVVCLVPAPVAV